MDENERDPEARAAWEHARSVWPQIDISWTTFRDAARNAREDESLEHDEAAELYLACACAQGHSWALSRFEATYIGLVPAVLHGMHLTPNDIDEIQQAVRRRLLVSDGSEPRLMQYAGRGSLRGLIRVMATRLAIDLLRRRDRDSAEAADELLRLPVGEDDPELAAIKAEHRYEFRVAFEQAMAGLTARQRTLLRLHYIDGIPYHKLAISHQVHRATVVRWVSAAKKELLEATVRHLATSTGQSPEGMRRFIELIRSRIELSLRRLLA